MKSLALFVMVGLLLAHETMAQWTRPSDRPASTTGIKIGTRPPSGEKSSKPSVASERIAIIRKNIVGLRTERDNIAERYSSSLAPGELERLNVLVNQALESCKDDSQAAQQALRSKDLTQCMSDITVAQTALDKEFAILNLALALNLIKGELLQGLARKEISSPMILEAVQKIDDDLEASDRFYSRIAKSSFLDSRLGEAVSALREIPFSNPSAYFRAHNEMMHFITIMQRAKAQNPEAKRRQEIDHLLSLTAESNEKLKNELSHWSKDKFLQTARFWSQDKYTGNFVFEIAIKMFKNEFKPELDAEIKKWR